MSRKIYALTADGIPFYIGSTKRSLEDRFCEHMIDALNYGRVSEIPKNIIKASWIHKTFKDRSLLAIEQIDEGDYYTERQHINHCIYDLANDARGNVVSECHWHPPGYIRDLMRDNPAVNRRQCIKAFDIPESQISSLEKQKEIIALQTGNIVDLKLDSQYNPILDHGYITQLKYKVLKFER